MQSVLWDVVVLVGAGLVVGALNPLLAKLAGTSWRLGLLLGGALVLGGLVVLLGSVDIPWWQTVVGLALVIIGGSALGEGWRARRAA